MKKRSMILLMALMTVGVRMAQNISLPQPNKKVKMTLFEALQQRHSVRAYSEKEVPVKTLSQLLWAACGKNRSDGKITAPSAVNAQDVLVFVCTKKGAYRYDADKHELVMVSTKDLRTAVAGRQAFAATAPVGLVLVSDLARLPREDKVFGAADAGYVSENICLACTALGLATVPRATMDQNVLRKELGLTDKQVLLLNHPVGFAAE